MLEEAQDDLRETIEAAYQEAKTEVPVEPEKVEQVERARDEHGRFAKADKAEPVKVEQAEPIKAEEPAKVEPAIEQPKVEPAKVEQPAAALAPPNGWSAEAKAKWHELSPEIQAAVAKREQDIAKFTGKTDEERSFGREMQRAVQPYLALIQSEGGTPAQAVQSLLNTAYILRMGSPQAKQQALMGVAQQFQVDLTNLVQQGRNTPPEIASLQQEIAQLKHQLTQQQNAGQQKTQAEVQQDIETFAADPKNAHFEEVKAHMAALLNTGAAKDLQDAYDQACWARPDIRTTLQAQARAEEEQKRRSEEQRRAEEAKRKAVSITGGPGAAASRSAPSDRSLREELEASFAAARAAV